ncbi:unnamed protein product [Allacma fusca]|uniref:Uncharacterized protein n=1 Tax=Allacma fusca TaxID=39272 RepID=A0A8J2JJ89_9HEXA|nr:unnamed protein product [Allacma fusca]
MKPCPWTVGRSALILSEMSYAEYYTPPVGAWAAPQPVQWIHCSNGNYPHNAIEAGHDSGARLLVARAYFNGALIPGKLHAGHTSCYVAWNGQEHPVPNYEVLVAQPGALRWVPSTGGYLLANAVLGGHSENGEQLLVGRAYHAGTTVPGKVHPSHRVCYIPYGGQEIPVSHYDVLMR